MKPEEKWEKTDLWLDRLVWTLVAVTGAAALGLAGAVISTF